MADQPSSGTLPPAKPFPHMPGASARPDRTPVPSPRTSC